MKPKPIQFTAKETYELLGRLFHAHRVGRHGILGDAYRKICASIGVEEPPDPYANLTGENPPTRKRPTRRS